ncbi:MAG TPA: ROK family protein [Bryobacteraceae bacterium]|nr:ROK family protein [Bryobacteraceae bacterium]
MRTLAIDIGGTKFTLALFDEERLIERESRPTDRAAGPEWMLDQIGRIAGDWLPFDRCGIGFGGPVDFRRQRVALSTHVAGWNQFPLAGRVAAFFHIPAIMDNDANAGALGESVYGAGRDARPMFYMTLSTGIGGGIVLPDGGLYRGADSWAGEIGHLTIRPGGAECLCGARGCLERMCCGLWLERDYGKPAHELFLDPEFVKGYVVNLAMGLKAAIMLLNPARIVIGGGIAKAGDRLFAPLGQELHRQMTAWSGARVDVVRAQLGDDSVLRGALALARISSAS